METLEYQIPKDDQRVEPPPWVFSRAELNSAVGLSVIILSLASFAVVFIGAGDEPYATYRRSDALVQVGGGVALMVLWLLCSLAVLLLIAKRKLSHAWLGLLLWAAICLFYLSSSPLGYLHDIEKFVIRPAAGG